MKIRIFHFFIIYILCACIPLFNIAKVPGELTGIWETTHPDYEQAEIEITSTDIVFKNGPDHIDKNRVILVQKTTRGDKQLYIIEYENEAGSRYSLPLYYSVTPPNNPVLRFKNQEKIIWEKST